MELIKYEFWIIENLHERLQESGLMLQNGS